MNEYQLADGGVIRLSDGAFIADSPDNKDWKEYQKWLADGGVPRPMQPGLTYVWDGSAWVEDLALVQAEANTALQEQLRATDQDSTRSMRTLLVELAKVSPLYPPVASSDRAFLLQNEQIAKLARSQLQPPTVFTLEEAKAQRIFELRIQLFAYIRLGFIWGQVLWSCDVVDMIVYMSLAGYQVSSNLLTPDAKLHIWDADHAEHILTPSDAGKLSAALYQWLYLAQSEGQAKAQEVVACTTVEEALAVTWEGRYTVESPYNADTSVVGPVSSGFTTGFDTGYG